MPPSIATLLNAYVDAWNRHDAGELARYFTDDCCYEDTAFGICVRGKDQIRDFCSASFRTFPNLRFDIQTVHGSADGMGWDWTMSGNYRTAIKELRAPATGQAILIKGASVTRLRDGLIEHNVDYYDSLKLLQQLGAFPSA